MLFKDLQQRRNIILKESTEHRYVLYAITEKELKSIQEPLILDEDQEFILEEVKQSEHDFLHMLYMGGDIRKTRLGSCKDIIETRKIHLLNGGETKESSELIVEYQCFQPNNNKHPTNNVVCHEDKLSSLKCACERVNSKFYLILKEDILYAALTKEKVLEAVKEVYNNIPESYNLLENGTI